MDHCDSINITTNPSMYLKGMEGIENLNYSNKVYPIHEENKSYKLKKHKSHRVKHLLDTRKRKTVVIYKSK